MSRDAATGSVTSLEKGSRVGITSARLIPTPTLLFKGREPAAVAALHRPKIILHLALSWPTSGLVVLTLSFASLTQSVHLQGAAGHL
jgi:hypothetical protein